MRFNSQAYDKVFPRTTEIEHVESSVETFKPSETEQENTGNESVVETGTDNCSGDGVEPSTEQGGVEDGNGNSGELDSE